MSLFESIQSKVILFLAIPVIYFGQRAGYDMTKMISQILLFFALAYNTDCLVSGRCVTWAWMTILFPIIMVIGYLFFNNKLDIPPPVRIPVPTMREQTSETTQA